MHARELFSTASAAAAAACTETLADLIACAEASSCEDFIDWSSGVKDVCTEPETTLRDDCGVDLRQ